MKGSMDRLPTHGLDPTKTWRIMEPFMGRGLPHDLWKVSWKKEEPPELRNNTMEPFTGCGIDDGAWEGL